MQKKKCHENSVKNNNNNWVFLLLCFGKEAFGVICMPTGLVYKIVFEDYNFVWLTNDLESAPYKKPSLLPQKLQIKSIPTLITGV